MRLCVFIFLLMAIANIATASTETYYYEAYPLKKGLGTQKESIEMQFTHSDMGLLYTLKRTSGKKTKISKIDTDTNGNFINGMKNVYDKFGKNLSASSIRHDDNFLYFKKRSGSAKKIKLPQDKPLAVNGSLLTLLRSFPFSEEKTWDVFMVNFSGQSAVVSIHRDGIENIKVPAGEFECYRMDVTVNLFIFRTKITYWITKEKPHFLVKHVGKNGPFTKSYVTYLTSFKN